MNRKHFLRSLGAGAIGLAGAASLRAALSADLDRAFPLPPSTHPGFWAAVRAAYSFKAGLAYFNTGGLGPAARPVRQTVVRVLEAQQEAIEAGHDRLDTVRAQAAAFVGASTGEVAFVRNATEGNGVIAGGLDLQPGDEVIFESHAHPGGSFSWLLQAERKGIRVKVFEPDAHDPAANLAAIEALATPRTRVVQVSHVTAPTGIHLPVAEIARLCQKRGWWFHVDGAQTLGMMPLDLHALGVDSYASSGHKWLGAPHESGLLYIREERVSEVAPIVAGAYTGDVAALPGQLQYAPGAARHEYGTRNAAIVAGVGAAMAFQERVGRERIAHRMIELADRFLAGLQALPEVALLSPREAPLRSGIVTIRSPRVGYRELFATLLSDHGIRCRPVSEEGIDGLRVSFHFFNTPEEVDRLLLALDTVLHSPR